MLNNIAEQLKAMEIPEVQEMALMLERLSSEKLISAQELNAMVRLENLRVYELKVKRPAKKRTSKTYIYWYASWRMNSKVKNVCLGSAKKMTHDDALIKARKLKAEYLGIDLRKSGP